MTWDQWVIVTLGPLAVALSQSGQGRVRRWAPIVGLAAQPAWFYATFTAGQWGIFFVSLIYSAAWGYGLFNCWIRK